ncbi:MAG: 4'-phosphopantetheinyl transferase superfamily protein [Clostridia bacterium]|nr:4'-phosphopantetheinyl transferase superfamily protein [Clostridia bacterium]
MNPAYKIFNINELSDEDYHYCLGLMEEGRRAQVERFRSEGGRRRSAAGELLARNMLAEFCGVPADCISFGRTDRGKPFAVGLAAEFNISHSGDFVICAVDDSPIGVDIEKIRPMKDILIRRVCSEKELAFVTENGICPDESNRRFFRVWTGKEAFFKCRGTGINADMRGICIFDEEFAKGLTFFVKDGYAVSVFSGK